MNAIILSHVQAQILLNARDHNVEFTQVSPDLGITKTDINIDDRGVRFERDQSLGWEEVESVAASPSSCYVIEHGKLSAIQFFSEETNRLYSLYPTAGAPSMLVSGIPMHRIKGTDPYQDTLEKIRTLKPVVGQVLDTATGLGYTAIQAARTADQVVTIELEPIVLQICRINPWSQELFDNPRITQIIGDSFDVVARLEAGRFTRIIHDPPAFRLAGDLYSGEFYAQLYRVMRNQAKLFHYIGDPDSKSGHNLTAGVIRRLEQVGFTQVRRAPRAFGVVAVK